MVLPTLLTSPGNRLTSALVFLFYATLLSTKDMYSYVIGALTLFSLWKLPSLSGVSLDKQEKSIMMWMLLFAGISIGATFWHGAYGRSFEVPVKFGFGVLLALCLIKFPPKSAALWSGLMVGAASGLAVASWKMWQAGELKAFGFTGAIQFGNLALSMAVLLMVALCWLMANQNAHRRLWFVLLALGAVCGLLGSYYSGTRGGWVAIPLFVAFFLLAYVRRSNLLVCGIALALLVSVSGLLTYQSSLIQTRVQEVYTDLSEYQEHGSSSSSSLGARFAIWAATWEILKDQPVLGVGEVQFRQALKAKSQAGLIGAVPAGLANTHNTFLEVWVWYGGLALLSLLLAMLSAARYFLSFIRHSDSVLRSYALGGLCLIGGYVIYGQTQIMLIRNNTLLFFLLSLAVLVALVHQRRRVVLVAENV
ncbi:O-antigen ligase family protein [Alcaligenes phenolicus]|uniref:O-antigen ligase family protein n=1 Tax=Alcaligenes TaxID=507 RepID=UPI0009F4ECF8|nr:O-antigen ligase family protein [Alcaligenes phenolicus]